MSLSYWYGDDAVKTEQKAKKIIVSEEIEKAGFNVLRVILFGSRSRGSYMKDSDFDFFVIIDNDIDFAKKREILGRIRIKLAELKIPNDVVIQSAKTADARKDNVGYLTYYVLKEGITIWMKM